MINGEIISQHRGAEQSNKTSFFFLAPISTSCKKWGVYSVRLVLHGSSVMASVVGDKHSNKGCSKHAVIFDIYFIMVISDNTYTSLGTSKTYTTAVLDELHK